MKIDIHTHTRKTKQGDAETRNIGADEFCKILTSTNVSILAITNHNLFDKNQYDDIRQKLDEKIQIWPGVELDVIHDGRKGHLLVIVCPKKTEEFSQILSNLTAQHTPDNFNISIEDTIKNFDKLKPLYIAHYSQKKPDLSDDAIELIIQSTSNKNRVLKEASNSISAGIFIEHGHRSIYGSDVHDWGTYVDESKNLPQLRLPVESFEHFCLLLEKDHGAINTVLNKKSHETLRLQPFEDGSYVELKCYNDINIFFGSKGTGKTKILEAISRHYCEKGVGANVFNTGPDKLTELYDIKGKNFSIQIENYDIDYCGAEITQIRQSCEKDVASIESYIQYFSKEITNKKAKLILLKDFVLDDEEESKRKFDSYQQSLNELTKFSRFLQDNEPIKEISSKDELNDIITLITALRKKLTLKGLELFTSWKQSWLFNSAVETVSKEISRKTGTPKKPMSTGFKEYAKERISLEASALKILDNLNKKIKIPDQYVGYLGEEKGEIYCRTNVVFQTGDIVDTKFSPVSKINKTPQKNFSSAIKKILSHVYKADLFEYITEFNDIDQIDEITSLSKMLLLNKCFVVGDESYVPSSGESSMLLLHKELETEKDVYILDEPEKSLGNDYISEVIVPLINEKARSGKKIFISTHDANIAVRTLPYNSVYRLYGVGKYKTYLGNPFSDNLVNCNDDKDIVSWKKISMKTLEGGEEAFGERGKIYGSS